MMPLAPILYFFMACLLLNFALELQAGVASNLWEGDVIYDTYICDNHCCVLLVP